jgi:hypothetical protein
LHLLARLTTIALGCILLERDAASGEIVTDINIVTALDISDSVDSQAAATEIDGMAEAIRSPAVIAAIQGGRYRRIGFAIFAWRDGAYPELVSWTVIATAENARAVSRRLRSDFHAFAASDPPAPPLSPHMTDLSGAIDHAAILLLTAPYVARRSVINVVGNGWDNVGEGPLQARDRFVATGGTINGVVLGFDPVLMDYYRGNVVGGPGAFVLSIEQPSQMSDVLARKFLNDIALRDQPDQLAQSAR